MRTIASAAGRAAFGLCLLVSAAGRAAFGLCLLASAAAAQAPAAAPGASAPAAPPPAPASSAPSTAPASPASPAPAPAAPVPAGPSPAAAAGPPADPFAGLPKVVAAAVRGLEAECRAENGTPHWQPESIFEVVNVSPDGRPDYLVDTHAIACDGGYTPWIGSDGFRHILLVSSGPGRWTRAFDRGARGFEITAPKTSPSKGGTPPRVVVFSHSAYCTRPNPERYMRCTQVFEWRRGRLRKISEDWFTD